MMIPHRLSVAAACCPVLVASASASLTDIADVFRRAVLAAAAVSGRAGATAEDRRLAGLLPGRVSGLRGEVGQFAGRPTADQRSPLLYYRAMADRLERGGR